MSQPLRHGSLQRCGSSGFLLVVLVAVWACGGTDYEELVASAERLLERGDIDLALERFVRAQRTDPARPEAYPYIVRICKVRGRPGVAIPLLEGRIRRGGGELHVYHVYLGDLQLAADRRREAETSYREAVRLEPGFARAHMALAELLAIEGRTDDAIGGIAEAARVLPDDPGILTRHGELLLKDGRYDEAETALSRVATRFPAHAPGRFFLGLVALHTGALERAREEFRAAVEAKPDFALAWYQLAHACEKLGATQQRDEALRRFAPLYRREVGVETGAP